MTVLKTENYQAVDLLHKTFTFVLILQPDEPYVSYIGSNGDYNPFVYQAGISSMDIRFMGGPVSDRLVSESMRNLSMFFPTRFTSKKGQNRHKNIEKVLCPGVKNVQVHI